MIEQEKKKEKGGREGGRIYIYKRARNTRNKKKERKRKKEGREERTNEGKTK